MHTTCWTVVLEAAGEGAGAGAALEHLCRRYWPPVYGFFLRSGLDRASAEDETQEFFARLLRREGLAGADPRHGSFRAFMLACLRHHRATFFRERSAQKRGGGNAPLELSDKLLEDAALATPELEPEAAYDRQWADTLMELAAARLAEEYKAAGRMERFSVLREYLMWDGGELSGRELAGRLGESETAVRSAIFRLRRRFAVLLREEVQSTLGPGENADEELRYLTRVLAQ